MEALRGTQGGDFEGPVTICRGEVVGCGCFGGGDSKKEMFIMIKGPFIFVFKHDKAQTPEYAISLVQLKVNLQGQLHELGDTIVTLQSDQGSIEYDLSFYEEALANEFVSAANKHANIGFPEEIKEVRLTRPRLSY